MTIEIFKRYQSIGTKAGDPWEQPDQLTALLWSRKNETTTVRPDRAPDGYASGLMFADIDGRHADLLSLDEALASIGETRETVMAAIAKASKA